MADERDVQHVPKKAQVQRNLSQFHGFVN